MNRESIMEQLTKELADFIIYFSLFEELLALLDSSGSEVRFFKLLIKRLRFLLQERVHAIKHEEFELLGSGIFSMHLSCNQFNIRILYAFLPNGNPALLHAFYERAGKSASDYTDKIDLGKSRIHELEMEALINE